MSRHARPGRSEGPVHAALVLCAPGTRYVGAGRHRATPANWRVRRVPDHPGPPADHPVQSLRPWTIPVTG